LKLEEIEQKRRALKRESWEKVRKLQISPGDESIMDGLNAGLKALKIEKEELLRNYHANNVSQNSKPVEIESPPKRSIIDILRSAWARRDLSDDWRFESKIYWSSPVRAAETKTVQSEDQAQIGVLPNNPVPRGRYDHIDPKGSEPLAQARVHCEHGESKSIHRKSGGLTHGYGTMNQSWK
jgi:hypothetical protein